LIANVPALISFTNMLDSPADILSKLKAHHFFLFGTKSVLP